MYGTPVDSPLPRPSRRMEEEARRGVFPISLPEPDEPSAQPAWCPVVLCPPCHDVGGGPQCGPGLQPGLPFSLVAPCLVVVMLLPQTAAPLPLILTAPGSRTSSSTRRFFRF